MLVLGKTEFGADEDAHVVGDCVKVLFWILDVIVIVRSLILFDPQLVQYSPSYMICSMFYGSCPHLQFQRHAALHCWKLIVSQISFFLSLCGFIYVHTTAVDLFLLTKLYQVVFVSLYVEIYLFYTSIFFLFLQVDSKNCF